MDKDQFLYLVARVLAGEASAAEKQLVKNTMREDPALRSLYHIYKKHWNSSDTQVHLSVEQALQATWNKINAQAEQQAPVVEMKTSGGRKWRWWAVATVVGIVGFAAWLFSYNRQFTVELAETYNKAGISSHLILSDGTEIWLAPDSRLTYPVTFGGATREVTLDGEAFFEVNKDPLHPFIVHTVHGDVRVLGTSFNVHAYGADDEVVTAVATGKVSYTPPGEGEAITLLPGKKARYHVSSGAISMEDVKEEAEWAWVSGKTVFQSDSLGRIATILYRRFGKPVTFKTNDYRSWRYTATFINRSPEEILEMLEKTRPFPFQVTDQSIIIGK